MLSSQLENGHTLFDYNIDINCLVQVMIIPESAMEEKESIKKDGDENNVHEEKLTLKDTDNQDNQMDEKESESSSDNTHQVFVSSFQYFSLIPKFFVFLISFKLICVP